MKKISKMTASEKAAVLYSVDQDEICVLWVAGRRAANRTAQSLHRQAGGEGLMIQLRPGETWVAGRMDGGAGRLFQIIVAWQTVCQRRRA
jgi:hypothetical protein